MNCIKQKKGMSLAEICVVLAVISIVSLMVISFTTMVSARSTVSAAKLKAMDDQELTEVILENWIDHMVAKQAVISVEENTLYATKDGINYTVCLEEDKLIAPLTDGTFLSCPINTVTELRFDHLTSSDDTIYFCTAVYDYPDPRGGTITREYTFCINPHIGETLH